MNERRARATVMLAGCLTALLALAPVARAEGEAPRSTIDDRTVIEMVLATNPSLAAARSDLRRAQLLEEAELHRYPFTLVVDGKGLRSGAPQLGAAGLTFPTSTTFSTGAELRRKLIWGTDLYVRLEATRQQSNTVFAFTPPGGAPVQQIFQLGPGYGGMMRLGFTQPLLRGAGRDVVLANLDAARVNRRTADSARDRTGSQLLLDALTAYWELYYASRSLDIQRRTLELARDQREEAAARVKTGSLAPVELLTFDSRIASLEEELVAVEAEERRRSTALGRLVGDPDLTPRRAVDEEPRHRDFAPSSDLRRRALESSPEISEQRNTLALAEVQARTVADPFRHRLDVDGYVQANGLGNREVPPVFDQLGALKAITAQVTLTYEAPLDNTRYRAEHERALVAVTAAKQRLDSTIQKVTADLDDAEQRRVSATLRIGLADRTLAVSKSQLDSEKARFKTGTGTALQVRVAEDQVRTSELRAVRARVDLAIADLGLLHVSGALVPQAAR
ncbi:MAG: TolC family protein [Labilithrix sp.]|nr:TolC family protein [Labilithrix sp.]MCW5818234.1 TolC family protein [Labilithrix sp.]